MSEFESRKRVDVVIDVLSDALHMAEGIKEIDDRFDKRLMAIACTEIEKAKLLFESITRGKDK